MVGVFISMRNVEFRTSSAVAVQTRGASERKPGAPSTGSLHVHAILKPSARVLSGFQREKTFETTRPQAEWF